MISLTSVALQGKASHPVVLRPHLSDHFSPVVEHPSFNLQRIAPFVRRLEVDGGRQPLHHASTLGEESHVQFLTLRSFPPHFGQPLGVRHFHHARIVVHALLFRRVEDGEHAREHRCILPIEHVCRVGPHLVETRMKQFGQWDVSVALSVLNLQLLRLQHTSFGCEQLHMEDAAQCRRLEPLRTHHIRLEPDGLAHEVSRVVEMQIHLFTREQLVIGVNAPHEMRKAVGGRGGIQPDCKQ